MFVSFLLLTILVFSFERFSKDWLIYFLTFGIIIGQVLFPVWFFQGMERMKYITYLNILAKSIFTVAIFIFVREESDFWIVPLLNSIGSIIAGICSLLIINNTFKIKFEFQKKEIILYHLYEGWYIFISGIFTLAYTLSIPFILGLLTNNIILGYYSISEKIIKSISGLYIPLNQAVYPYINKLIQTSEKKAKAFTLRLLSISGVIMLILSIIIYLSSEYIIYFITGKILIPAIMVLKILSIFPFIITIARIFSFNYIISFGYQKELSTIYLLCALASIPITLFLIISYQETGAALAVIIIESLVNILMYRLILKKIGF
jgi:PST family polysaccharide transporter